MRILILFLIAVFSIYSDERKPTGPADHSQAIKQLDIPSVYSCFGKIEENKKIGQCVHMHGKNLGGLFQNAEMEVELLETEIIQTKTKHKTKFTFIGILDKIERGRFYKNSPYRLHLIREPKKPTKDWELYLKYRDGG